MKKVFAALVAISLGAFCVGCTTGPSASSAPEKINVVGMTLDDACEALSAEGWFPHPVDETPYSDYVPGAWENGVTDYDDCAVTRVEFSPSEPARRGYATVPSCNVYFASESQPQQEAIYDLELDTWLYWYDLLVDELEAYGATEEVLTHINQAYGEILGYDDDLVPTTRKDVHQQLIGRYQALLDSAS